MHRSITVFILAVLGFGAAVVLDPARPAEAADKNYIVVQLNPMMMPYRHLRGNYRSVTPLIEAKPHVEATEICAFSPKVREAIFLTLNSDPPDKVKDGEFILPPALHQTLIQRVNAAVGGDKIRRIHILDVVLSMGGGWQSRLPFATIAGCKEFKEMEKEKAKQKN